MCRCFYMPDKLKILQSWQVQALCCIFTINYNFITLNAIFLKIKLLTSNINLL